MKLLSIYKSTNDESWVIDIDGGGCREGAAWVVEGEASEGAAINVLRDAVGLGLSEEEGEVVMSMPCVPTIGALLIGQMCCQVARDCRTTKSTKSS